ncbi:cytidylyltransferase domain-containing protein [Maricaulis sp. CAU 1757]
MSRTIAVIQARTGSHRFPGKVLAPLVDDLSILTYQCRRLRAIRGVDELVIATTDKPDDDAIVEIAAAEQVGLVRGSEQDVLDRFIKAADERRADTLVRITSDSPLRDPAVIETCLDAHIANAASYTRPCDGHLPRGMRAEIVESAALRDLASDPSTSARHREHVTLAIRENPDRFPVCRVAFPAALHHPGIDLSVDRPDDLVYVQNVLAELDRRDWPVDCVHICRLAEEHRGVPPRRQENQA